MIVFGSILSSPSSICPYIFSGSGVGGGSCVGGGSGSSNSGSVLFWQDTIPLSSIKHLLLALIMLSVWGKSSGQYLPS